jgi:FkbM family methyltransferase
MKKSHTILQTILAKDDSLIVIDGGARNGPKDLVGLEEICQFHCFEPNPSELDGVNCSIVNEIKVASKQAHTNAYPFALCGVSGTTTLNISMRPGATSTLEPNKEFVERFAADNFSEMRHIVERIQVPAISLHDFMHQAELRSIDFIKLDTQGNELDILKSAGDYLDSVSVIMTEVEMVPLYQNQPLFHDVSQFLCSRGFELVDLRSTATCRRFHARSDLPPTAYRLVWGDAIFVRRPADADKPRSIQQGLVLAGLGYADMAIDLFDRNSTLTIQQKRDLERFARWAAEPHWFSGRIKRVLERTLGLLIQRYHWRTGHQVKSLKSKSYRPIDDGA